ncbi:hypothetical protein Hdeb2414_s0020g00562361 [Helianthus debilis subsp. tardiflorus]
MSEENIDTNVVRDAAPRRPRSMEDDESGHSVDLKAMETVQAKSETEDDEEEYFEDKPSKGEVMGWCFYELCSYFTHTVLLTIVFPLIISQSFGSEPPQPAAGGLYKNGKGFHCTKKETDL